MFVYLFSVNVTFLPSLISTRWFLALPGAFLMLIYYKSLYKRTIHYKKTMNSFWKSLWLFYFTVLCSSILNGRFDGFYSSYPITILLITTASFCLIYLLNKIWKGVDLRRYFWLLVLTCVGHQLLSIAMFFFPVVNDVVFSIIQQSALEERANELTILNRFHTVGIAYFGAGALYSYCILLTVILSQHNYKFIKRWVIPIILVFLFAVGSAVSRTTMMGLIVALVYLGLIILRSKGSQRIIKLVKYVFCGAFALLLTFTLFNKYIADNFLLESIIEHAFEGICNLFNDGKFTTSSSEKMFDAYIWPDNLWTWLIGDAKLKGVDEFSYYMFTDIGWCRLIFDFGLIGTIAFIFMQWKLLKVVFVQKINYLVVFVLFLSFQFKGISELIVYFMPAAMLWLFKEPYKK